MIIGLTGGIASGKSLCSDWFAARAVSVIDADVIARKVVTKGSPVLQELAAAFGNDVLQDNGNLNRAALRARAFVNDDARARLNTIMQPRIREHLLQELERAPRQPYRILSAPLLLENRLDALCVPRFPAQNVCSVQILLLIMKEILHKRMRNWSDCINSSSLLIKTTGNKKAERHKRLRFFCWQRWRVNQAKIVSHSLR